MSQKINPITNKLGALQTWNYQLQTYGRNFESYNNTIQLRNYTLMYIQRFLLQSNLLVKDINFIYSIQQITINIFVFNFKFQSADIKDKVILNTISCWLNTPAKILVYQSQDLSNSSFLVNSYIAYLFSLKTTSTKQLLQLIFNILKKQANKTKLIYTINGLQLVKFKGFKLEFTGCFESSRSQMSKTLKCSFGPIPLTKLNGCIEYSSDSFFTKFGVCGLKLWFFYELF